MEYTKLIIFTIGANTIYLEHFYFENNLIYTICYCTLHQNNRYEYQNNLS